MKRDHDQPRAGPQPSRRPLEKAIEAFELVINPDAQRLKRARRRVDAGVPPPWDRAADDRREAERRRNRRILAGPDDGARDAA